MNTGYPPDLLVHSTTAPSTGWQQQESFESSIVTESHYDASFESEIPPMRAGGGGSIDRADSTTSSGPPPLPTSQRNKQHLLKRPSNQSVSLNKVACQNSAAKGQQTTSQQTMTTTTGPDSASSQNGMQKGASGLMLWKKVQHYVVVGGAFANPVNSQQPLRRTSASVEAPVATTAIAASTATQPHFQAVVPTTAQSKLMQPPTTSFSMQQQQPLKP